MPHIRDFQNGHIHMMGIGGSSMSGLAKLLHQKGYRVSGCDRDDSDKLHALSEKGIACQVAHSPDHLEGVDMVVYTAAISPDNPEYAAALSKGIPTLERAVMLGQLMEGYPCAIGISGTHGKTTTTSMVAQLLSEAGLSPTVHIGGELDALGGSTVLGGDQIFVMEACEFNASFLHFPATIAVITNIDADHLDFYRDIDHIEETFAKYLAMVPENGWAVGWGDDPRVLRVIRGAACGHIAYGLGPDNDWRAENLTYDSRGRASFDAVYQGGIRLPVFLAIPGEYSVLNALCALAVAKLCGADLEGCADTLSRFANPHRRFEHTGTVDGVLLYHDYAHNPAEIQNAVTTASLQPHGRLWAVWQPHTYSRTKALFQEFLTIFEKADKLLVTDIYAAREKDPGDIKTEMLLGPLKSKGVDVVHTPAFDDAEAHLRAHWKPGDFVITLGCGNIHLLNAQIQKHGDSK